MKKIILIMLVLISSVNAEIICNPEIDNKIVFGKCYYNIDGSLRTLDNITSFKWVGDLSGHYLLNAYGIDEPFNVSFKPYLVSTSNDYYSIDEIKSLFPNIDFKQYIIKNEGFKWGINLTAIPEGLKSQLKYIALSINDWDNVNWEDVEINNTLKYLLIKDEIVLSYYDIVYNNYSIELYNKTLILIGNITDQENIFIDPYIIINTRDSGIVDDSYLDKGNSAFEYGAATLLKIQDSSYNADKDIILRFNATQLKDINVTEIINSTLYFRIQSFSNWSGLPANINVTIYTVYDNFSVSNNIWTEGNGDGVVAYPPEISYGTRPTGSYLSDTPCAWWNTTIEPPAFPFDTDYWIDVSPCVNEQIIEKEYENITLYLTWPKFGISEKGNAKMYSKENARYYPTLTIYYDDKTYNNTVEFWVYDFNTLQPIYNATVNMYNSSLGNYTGQTNVAGHLIFDSEITSGNYNVTASEYSHITQSFMLEIINDSIVSYIYLIPVEPNGIVRLIYGGDLTFRDHDISVFYESNGRYAKTLKKNESNILLVHENYIFRTTIDEMEIFSSVNGIKKYGFTYNEMIMGISLLAVIIVFILIILIILWRVIRKKK